MKFCDMYKAVQLTRYQGTMQGLTSGEHLKHDGSISGLITASATVASGITDRQGHLRQINGNSNQPDENPVFEWVNEQKGEVAC